MRYIYRITNLINGKTYIGQHKVKKGRTITSDTYWGSGKIITESIKKYGKNNFKKEILVSGDFTKEEINRFEICAIFFERLNYHSEYNISDGGESPFSNSEFAKKAASKTDYSKVSKTLKEYYSNLSKKEKDKIVQKRKETCLKRNISFKTKGTTSMHFKKAPGSSQGSKNSQFGTHWYTNGEVNIKAKECPEGFRPGRV